LVWGLRCTGPTTTSVEFADPSPNAWNELDLAAENIIVDGDFCVQLLYGGPGYTGKAGIDRSSSSSRTYRANLFVPPFPQWNLVNANLMVQAEVSGTPPGKSTALVGGVFEPVNKAAVFAHCLALFGLVAVVAIVVVAPWKKPHTN
jgi:hypothetical protein